MGETIMFVVRLLWLPTLVIWAWIANDVRKRLNSLEDRSTKLELFRSEWEQAVRDTTSASKDK